MSYHCLNCETEVVGKYCHNCGQPTTTHRLSLKHFLAHDLLHGFFHLDKGILYTMKNILLRPGFLAKEYIAGKRAGHFNIATLLLLTVGAFLFILSLKHLSVPELRVDGKNAATFVAFVIHNSKWLLLLIIPISAKASKDIFTRLKYNITEHLVINAFFFAGVFFIMLVCLGFYFIPYLNNIFIIAIEFVAIVAYLIFAFKQLKANLYSSSEFLFRMLLYFIAMIGYLAGVIFAFISAYALLRHYF